MKDGLITVKAEPETACNWDDLKPDMCSCSECGWRGPVASCELKIEDNGWEYPATHYHSCPVCELGEGAGMIDSYWNSILELFDATKEEHDLYESMSPEIHAGEPDRTKPPCLECGAMTVEEGEKLCICAGDKDNCHGAELWP